MVICIPEISRVYINFYGCRHYITGRNNFIHVDRKESVKYIGTLINSFSMRRLLLPGFITRKNITLLFIFIPSLPKNDIFTPI